MLWRVEGNDPIVVTVDGADVVLDPGRLYDDQDPEDLRIIAGARRFLTTPNVEPERATAAPGEKRTTRRK